MVILILNGRNRTCRLLLSNAGLWSKICVKDHIIKHIWIQNHNYDKYLRHLGIVLLLQGLLLINSFSTTMDVIVRCSGIASWLEVGNESLGSSMYCISAWCTDNNHCTSRIKIIHCTVFIGCSMVSYCRYVFFTDRVFGCNERKLKGRKKVHLVLCSRYCTVFLQSWFAQFSYVCLTVSTTVHYIISRWRRRHYWMLCNWYHYMVFLPT